MTDVRRIQRYEGRFTVPEFDWDNTYYVGRLDGAPYVWLHVQTSASTDFAMLHLALRGFNRRILQEALADFATVRAGLRAAGIRKIFLMKEFPFRTWEKLIRLLGFGAPCKTRIADKVYKTVLMEVK